MLGSRLALTPRIVVTVRDLDGTITRRWEGENVVTQGGLTLLRNALRTGEDIRIRHMAVGDDPTAPNEEQFELVNERFRKQITARSIISHNQVVTTTYIAPGEANFNISELGWFAGPDSSNDANTGVMFARTLFDLDKTILESVQVDRIDIFNEVT